MTLVKHCEADGVVVQLDTKERASARRRAGPCPSRPSHPSIRGGKLIEMAYDEDLAQRVRARLAEQDAPATS